MDPLELIREKISRLDQEKHPGLIAVAHHIDIAHEHFNAARSTSQDYYFTDVIYRTNQAFEGILKEAYLVFSGKTHEHLRKNRFTPHDIEEYLTKNEVFRQHVRAYFSTYRKEWRNVSTHDHGLNFDEPEAFLAIMTVSAFVNILLDQILERVAYKKETAVLRDRDVQGFSQLESLPLQLQLKELLLRFSERIMKDASLPATFREVEISGRLQAYITATLPYLEVEVQPGLERQDQVLRPDFLIRNQSTGAKVVLELKGFAPISAKSYDALKDQLIRYLVATSIRDGIGYIIPRRSAEQVVTEEITHSIGDESFNLIMIYPVYPAPTPSPDKSTS